MEELKISVFLLILITAAYSASVQNSTSTEEEPIAVEDEEDDDQELSVQLHDVETRANGWTAWSEWSPCSRSCDGGVSHQLRRCQVNGCRGDRIRHKICNMQPCPESHDFRDAQCAAYNSAPYEGTRYSWQAHYDDLEPCSLVCRGRNAAEHHQGMLKVNSGQPSVKQMGRETIRHNSGMQIMMAHEPHKDIDEHEGNDLEQDVVVVAKMADRVQDGTRCRPGSLDMCINGDCQRVGCDLRIGSTKQVDVCGVCGGDGSSCTRNLYHWSLAPMSLCSATCGTGYKMSHAVCQNRVTGEEVEEQLCNQSQKPNPAIENCNSKNCPPKWSAGDWGACSATCGGGQKMRQIYCVEESSNTTKIKVKEEKCSGSKPRYVETCNQEDCPQWHSSQWSGCSVSCGEGHQSRTTTCTDHKGHTSTTCAAHTQPTATKPCSTGIQCPTTTYHHEEDDDNEHTLDGTSNSHRQHLHALGQHRLGEGEDQEEVLLLPGLYHTLPLMQPYPPPQAERLVGENQVVPSESTFIPEEWGPCSATCGEGVRRRKVDCKIFLEFSRTIAKLPDKQCTGPKPIEDERCYMEPCSSERVDIKDDPYSRPDTAVKVVPGTAGKTYSWQEQGYTHCSATCLGGVQELIVNCVRDDNGRGASPYLCSRDLKPEILIRTCNDHPCPPRWNYSDFQPCTQVCGIGIQTREVNCIHEVTQGGGNTVVVPNNMCPQPPPPDRQYCNVLDCPVKWKTSDWSKCSKICGGGEKTRDVQCKQVMAQNHTISRPDEMCANPKPSDKKPCNSKSCVLDSDKPHIETANTTFIQHDPKKKKLTLKVGGAATVFYGTVIKIKCPVKRFNRTKIQWAKDHTYLPNKSKKYKTSKKGALRVQNLTYRDSGVYTCVAGRSSADLALSVRPKPGEFLTSEEIQRQSGYRSERVDLEIADVHREDGNPNFDDQSHEQRPDAAISRKKVQKTKLFTATLPSLTKDSNSLNAWPQHSTFATSREKDDKMSPTHLSASSADSNKPVFESTAKSTGSRTMPHFQLLISNLQHLWPFQTFGNSRGHRMVAAFPPPGASPALADSASYGADEWPSRVPQLVEGAMPYRSQEEYDDEEEDEEGSVVVLGKGSPENLRFDWIVSEWSKCSQSCGGNGYQVRNFQCLVSLHNTSQKVESNLCEDAGLEMPKTSRKCGLEDCPKWTVGEWTTCDTSRCFSMHIAMQKREVRCKNQNNITMEGGRCNASEKPMQRQECRNERCIGKWKSESWSECAANCNGVGIKYRILRCVWYGTKKPAGNACRNQPRPPVTKPCKGPSCIHEPECRDTSMFCPNVRTMNMCRLARYQQQCCRSCTPTTAGNSHR